MEIVKLSIWLWQQKDHHELKRNYSRFTKEGFQCNDSPPWCNKSWNVHWRGSFPLSPIIRQTFAILPQKLGMLLFDTFERGVFTSPGIFLVLLMTCFLFCGRIMVDELKSPWRCGAYNFAWPTKRESKNIHLIDFNYIGLWKNHYRYVY